MEQLLRRYQKPCNPKTNLHFRDDFEKGTEQSISLPNHKVFDEEDNAFCGYRLGAC